MYAGEDTVIMKNACIVLRNCKDSVCAIGFGRVTDAFLAGGYCFSEIRLLPSNDEAAFADAVSGFRAETENLAVIVGKDSLAEIGNLLAGLMKSPFSQRTLSGAGIFSDGEFSLFLLAAEAGESGAEYVRGVCLPFLERKYGLRYDRMVLRAVGADAETVKNLLAAARRMSGERLTYNYRRKYAEDVLEIVYDSSVPKMLTDDVLRLLTEGLGDCVYALDDTPLEKRLVQLLKLREKKISVGESFTGGGLARRIVSVPGASEVYFEGLNTYDELAKRKRLGVSEYTLRTVGAVSDETAYEMASGLIATGDCDISVATTGLAGPKSDRTELPVGLCYIAVGLREKVYVYRYRFDGSREDITETAINYALFLAYRQLRNL